MLAFPRDQLTRIICWAILYVLPAVSSLALSLSTDSQEEYLNGQEVREKIGVKYCIAKESSSWPKRGLVLDLEERERERERGREPEKETRLLNRKTFKETHETHMDLRLL
jgi:hypothetical protein